MHLTEDFTIKIFSLNEKKIDLNVNNNTTISQIKNLLLEKTDVPIDKQRLIFRGKLLEDSKPVCCYGISSSDVIHFIAKINQSESESEEIIPRNIPPQRATRFSNQIIDDHSYPISSFRNNMLLNTQPNSIDTLSSILQNNFTLSSMLNNKNFLKDHEKLSIPIEFIDFDNRYFTKGQ